MRSFPGTVGLDADNVVTRQAALIDARGGDPHVARFVANRQIAPRRGGHAISIDALHRMHDFVARMLEIAGLGRQGRELAVEEIAWIAKKHQTGKKIGPDLAIPLIRSLTR